MCEQEFYETREDVRQSVDRVAETGFEIVSLWSLVIGTRYRQDVLYWEKVHKLEGERNCQLSPEERGQLAMEMGASYDRFSPPNLAETLRYQYDRATGEKKLKRPPFPEVGSDAYNKIITEMATLGPSLNRLIELRRDSDPFLFLPYKHKGIWYNCYGDIPDDQK